MQEGLLFGGPSNARRAVFPDGMGELLVPNDEGGIDRYLYVGKTLSYDDRVVSVYRHESVQASSVEDCTPSIVDAEVINVLQVDRRSRFPFR